MLDFTNTEIAFRAKTNTDLRRAQLLFTVIKYPWIVKCCKFATNVAAATHFPIGWAVKPTIYKHFVGGETLEECTPVVKALDISGVKSILDYSAEGGESQADIDRTFNETIHSIEYSENNSSIAYTVFKPTAMTTDAVLEKASEGKPLNAEEQVEIEKFRERMYLLCKKAHDLNVRILIDAEDYCFQNEIDRVTDDLMRQFNKERAIVFTTFQMYRHDRLPYLQRLYADACENNYIVGMKFVRGAYMEHERARAADMGYPDPICPTKADTDDNFNAGLKFVVEHLDHFELFSGTHNEYSNRYLAELLDSHGIARNDSRVFFAQLYGMSDNLSYNLADAGYNVTKYIPYAPVNTVLPYLIRRAEENTAMAGQTTRELNMINSEIHRRRSAKRAPAYGV